MHRILIIILLALPLLSFSKIDTIVAVSEVTDVTVFFSGAQVSRSTKIQVNKGKHLIKLSQLPYEINKQSIQVKGVKNCDILSVKHQLVYPTKSNKDDAVLDKENKIDAQEIKIKEIKNTYRVFEMEEKLLLDNSNFNNENVTSSISTIKEAADFYRLRLNEIKKEKLKLAVALEKANEQLQEMYQELNKIIVQKNQVFSEILISLGCETNINAKLNISYYVPSAAWSPTYDFRVEEINQDLQIVYNANVYQTSGEDWKNVNLTLSSNNPSLSGTVPELVPWYLDRYRNVDNNNTIQGSGAVQGRVFDASNNEALAFANVVLLQNNEQIAGTTTDFDGQYNIKPVPPGYYNLKVTYVGYQSTIISNIRIQADKITFQDVNLNQAVSLNEIEVVEYAVPLIEKDNNSSGSTITREEFNRLPTRSAKSVAGTVGSDLNIRGSRSAETEVYIDGVKVKGSKNFIPNVVSSRVTSIEYAIEVPYSIPSDGKDYNIKIKESNIPVNYIYHSIPKLESDVFLTAELTDWSELNLLSGNANIYFQGTYTGEAYIDVAQTTDTLKLSLGRDKGIIVQREFNKELNDKKFLGSNVKETIAWDIKIRNNKNVPVKIIVEDQFPISERKSLEVERLEYSNAKLNEQTGKLSWDLQLAAGERKQLSFKYAVKYPQGSNLYFE